MTTFLPENFEVGIFEDEVGLLVVVCKTALRGGWLVGQSCKSSRFLQGDPNSRKDPENKENKREKGSYCVLCMKMR